MNNKTLMNNFEALELLYKDAIKIDMRNQGSDHIASLMGKIYAYMQLKRELETLEAFKEIYKKEGSLND